MHQFYRLLRVGVAHRSITPDPLRSLYRVVETRPAQVHILRVGIGGEQLQQTPQDDIIIVIHVTEPPRVEWSK